MKVKLKAVILAVIGVVIISPETHAQSIVYPQKGQSQEQQSKDEYECSQWAKTQTGIDPNRVAAQGAVAYAPNGQMVRGAGRGAALGAVGGAIGGDAGEGAAVGAGVGATAGLIRRHRQQQAAEQYNQQAQNNQQQSLQVYNRAVGACMEGRGYVVK